MAVLIAFLGRGFTAAPQAAQVVLPEKDTRASTPKDLNTPWTFPPTDSKSAWQERARFIRQHILVSCGLWPLPRKTPLNPRVFGRITRDNYTIENVCFESYPGFYVAGNLYRPSAKGNGPFPAVLNPHGHWSNGRMADTPQGSVAARCINFAKQGLVAFSYDMVGYNDTAQVSHNFASHPTNQLWNISLMGLQTWNSIRALDLLESLPDVDRTKLACTGESGGGTQTFILGAVDDRLAVQAPVVMVSHSMQGGCQCENAPGLRVHFSNMEIAAAAAPRPQILVAATGDWTRATLEIEGPAIQQIYRLFQAADRFGAVRYDYGHNYNKTSREAVYGFFAHWLLNSPNSNPISESAYVKEPDHDLRVWPDAQRPADALNEPALIRSLITQAQHQLDQLRPTNQTTLTLFRQQFYPAWQHCLQIDIPENGLLSEVTPTQQLAQTKIARIALGRAGKHDRLPALMLHPARDNHRLLVLLAHPDGKSAYCTDQDAPRGLAQLLLDRGITVLLSDLFLTGELADPEAGQKRNPTRSYFTTYNRTDLQERVQDLITLTTFAQQFSKGRKVVLCGQGRAGLWTLLAAPAADAVVANCTQFDPQDDAQWLAPDLFSPGLKRIGSFQGVAALAAPHPLFLHNTGPKFATAWLESIYRQLAAASAFRTQTDPSDDHQLAEWIAALAEN